MLTEAAQTANGIQTFGNTTDASSITTGSVISSGGAGIAKKLYLGSDIFMTGANAAKTNTGMLIGYVINAAGYTGFIHSALTPNGGNYALIQSSAGGTFLN